jgi:hypothetical protein
LYEALLAHAIHQDALFWGRVQVLLGIQAGVLAGAFVVRDSLWLALPLLLVGALLTGLLLLLASQDRQDRLANQRLLDTLGRRLLSDRLIAEAQLCPSLPIRFSAERHGITAMLSGSVILFLSLLLLVLVDLGFAVLLVLRALDVCGLSRLAG